MIIKPVGKVNNKIIKDILKIKSRSFLNAVRGVFSMANLVRKDNYHKRNYLILIRYAPVFCDELLCLELKEV
jgi:hypothetical protein